MSKGIGICCADIYLEFPEIMEEEFIELCNFLDDLLELDKIVKGDK